MHRSVLLNESIALLDPKKGDVIIDATAGGGGHSEEILKRIIPDGLLIAIDQDDEALNICSERFKAFPEKTYRIIKANFKDMDQVIMGQKAAKINGIIFDLGVSSYHLDIPVRGFSINADGPLDMRMDRANPLTAAYVVNKYPEHKLFEVLRAYGEEPFARRIARNIVNLRKKARFDTTRQLVSAVMGAVGRRSRWSAIHPATRTFQAIRIEVNRELDALEEAIKKLPALLSEGGRIAAISFHSLEDRIVKNLFKQFQKDGIAKILTKKPVTAGEEEKRDNPRSRSAKLRALQFVIGSK